MIYILKMELRPIEEDGVHIFLKGRINGRPARFLVDTGASRTVVDQSRIVTYFNPDEASFENLDTFSAGLGTNTMESRMITLKTLSFGRVILKDYRTAALDLTHVNQSYSLLKMKKIDGVVGGDLLSRLNAVIDYRKKEIKFY